MPARRGQSWQWGSGLHMGAQGALPAPVWNRELGRNSPHQVTVTAAECQLPPRQTDRTHVTPLGVKCSALDNGADLGAPAMPKALLGVNCLGLRDFRGKNSCCLFISQDLFPKDTEGSRL